MAFKTKQSVPKNSSVKSISCKYRIFTLTIIIVSSTSILRVGEPQVSMIPLPLEHSLSSPWLYLYFRPACQIVNDLHTNTYVN